MWKTSGFTQAMFRIKTEIEIVFGTSRGLKSLLAYLIIATAITDVECSKTQNAIVHNRVVIISQTTTQYYRQRYSQIRMQ